MYSSKKSGNIILKDHHFSNFRDLRNNGFWPKPEQNESLSNGLDTTNQSNQRSHHELNRKWDPNTSRFLNTFESTQS